MPAGSKSSELGPRFIDIEPVFTSVACERSTVAAAGHVQQAGASCGVENALACQSCAGELERASAKLIAAEASDAYKSAGVRSAGLNQGAGARTADRLGQS